MRPQDAEDGLQRLVRRAGNASIERPIGADDPVSGGKLVEITRHHAPSRFAATATQEAGSQPSAREANTPSRLSKIASKPARSSSDARSSGPKFTHRRRMPSPVPHRT